MKTIREMCIWIKENLGTDVPLHFTGFFPAYRMTHLPPTPIKTLEQAGYIAVKEGKCKYCGCPIPGLWDM
jgi:pyruvate formate lyase activating enzyme